MQPATRPTWQGATNLLLIGERSATVKLPCTCQYSPPFSPLLIGVAAPACQHRLRLLLVWADGAGGTRTHMIRVRGSHRF